LRDDGIVPLICPTCQNVFRGAAQSIHPGDSHATLHGVVFDILVGSEYCVGLEAQKRGLPSRSSRAERPAFAIGFGAAAVISRNFLK